MMWRREPKTEPCGNPYGAGTHGDLVGPWTTQRVRSPRNDSSQQRNAPVTPKDIRNMLFNGCASIRHHNITSGGRAKRLSASAGRLLPSSIVSENVRRLNTL